MQIPGATLLNLVIALTEQDTRFTKAFLYDGAMVNMRLNKVVAEGCKVELKWIYAASHGGLSWYGKYGFAPQVGTQEDEKNRMNIALGLTLQQLSHSSPSLYITPVHPGTWRNVTAQEDQKELDEMYSESVQTEKADFAKQIAQCTLGAVFRGECQSTSKQRLSCHELKSVIAVAALSAKYSVTREFASRV